MSGAGTDRRIERTRRALVDAFVALFFERSYDEISVAAIVERAGIGRSTFYEHFRGKDEMLAETIRYPFERLASSVDAGADRSTLIEVLDHFWSNRANARATVGREGTRRAVTRVLAAMIGERLDARLRATGVARSSRTKIVAVLLAEAEIGAILAWTTGELAGSAADLADAILGFAEAATAALPGMRTHAGARIR